MSDDHTAAALLYLATHPDSTTSDVASAVFDPDGDEELRNSDRKIRYYFTDKIPHLIESDKEGKTTYRVDDELVDAGLGRLEMQSFDGDTFSVGLGGVVLYSGEDGEPHVSVVGDVSFEGDE